MRRRTMRAVAGIAAMGIAATGCSHSGPSLSPAESSAAASSAAMAQLWDPCTLPDGLITQAGLDAATKKQLEQFSGTKNCHWIGTNTRVTVMTAVAGSFAKVRSTTNYQDFEDATVGGRPALFWDTVGGGPDSYDVAFELKGGGLVDITVNKQEQSRDAESGRVWAERVATVLVNGLPA